MTAHAPTLVALVRAHARAELANLRATTPPPPHPHVTLAVLEATAIRDIEPPPGAAGWAVAETADGWRAAWIDAPALGVDPYGLAASA